MYGIQQPIMFVIKRQIASRAISDNSSCPQEGHIQLTWPGRPHNGNCSTYLPLAAPDTNAQIMGHQLGYPAWQITSDTRLTGGILWREPLYSYGPVIPVCFSVSIVFLHINKTSVDVRRKLGSNHSGSKSKLELGSYRKSISHGTG